MQVNWNGIYPAITTKFHKDGTLDLETFQKNIQAQLEAGIHGIVLGGTLGEASTLKKNEKLQLVKKTISLIEGQIPVIMNIAEQTTASAVDAAIQAQENNVSGLMLLPPMRYKADDRETLEFFKSVVTSTDLPVMIYNNPVDYGIEVTLDMFAKLAEFDNVQAVKDSTRDIANVTRMINRFGERFKILCGVDTLALDALFMGASGWVAGLVCAFPRETVAVYELAKSGQHEEALKLFRWFMPLLELDVDSKLVQNIKLAEATMGIGTEHVRKPRLKLEGRERERVQDILNEALQTRPQILNLLKENGKSIT